MTAPDTPSPPTTATTPAAAGAAKGPKGKGPRPKSDRSGAAPAASPTIAAAQAPVEEVATTTADGKPVDVRNLQDKFNGMLDQRNQFNDLARAARENRDQLNEQRRQKALEIEEHKKARDAANEEMRVHKELRNAYQDQAKALIAQKKGKAGAIERSLPLTVRKLRNDLQQLIEQQQTTS